MVTNLCRSELGAFLRSRRELIAPEQAGLPSGGRRRTPRLRREEVAQLAGVGLTWYTWLEQGRPINASAHVLDAVARVLGLDNTERDHVQRLAGNLSRPLASAGSTEAPPDVDALLRAVDPLPAGLFNDRTELLQWNRAYRIMNPELVTAEPGRRSAIWELFVDDRRGGHILDRDERAPQVVAGFRYRYGQHLGDPDWQDLVAHLRVASTLFAQLWATKDVAPPRLCDKRYTFTGLGEIHLRATGLDLSEHPGHRLIVYAPVDDGSRHRLDQLLHPAESH